MKYLLLGSVEVRFVHVRNDEKHRIALLHHPKVHLVKSESSLFSLNASEQLSSFSSEVFELVWVQFVHPSFFWPRVSWLRLILFFPVHRQESPEEQQQVKPLCFLLLLSSFEAHLRVRATTSRS